MTTDRTRWVIGNWKQNLHSDASQSLAQGVLSELGSIPLEPRPAIGIAPTMVALPGLPSRKLAEAGVTVFGQNVAAQASGAFTGEVGPAMLRDVGASGALIGHSERRAHFLESEALLNAKVLHSLSDGLKVVLCVGEQLDARDAGIQDEVVLGQVLSALAGAPPDLVRQQLIVAYEPVWAIGTGRTATPEQAQAMHSAIRSQLFSIYGADGTDRPIIYGGSVKASNAQALIEQDDIDGFLVGGASLDAKSFCDIIRSVSR